MSYTASDVKRLRELTAAGMMDCKNALVESEGDFNKAIELEPDYAYAYCRRGLAKYILQDYKGAIADYNKAIDLKPFFAQAYFYKGNALFELKETNQSIGNHSINLTNKVSLKNGMYVIKFTTDNISCCLSVYEAC